MSLTRPLTLPSCLTAGQALILRSLARRAGSWELDALEPKVLTNLIRTHVADLTDARLLERASAKEKQDKVELELVKDNWHDAVDLLRDAVF